MKGIMVAGSMLVDNICEIGAYPKAGELAGITGFSRAPGGCVPNVAADLKALSPSVGVYAAGRVGRDEAGAFLVDFLSGLGIDVSGVIASDAPTSFTEVMSVKGGQRTFFTYAGASSHFGAGDIDFDKTDVEMLHLGYLLLLDKIDAGDGEKILREAKKRGIRTSVDMVTSADKSCKKAVLCLKYVDNLIINETEAARLAGTEEGDIVKAAYRLKELGVSERVIIHMPEAAVCVSDSGCAKVASLDLPAGYIKGTTGAGDAFCAGTLIGIYEGLDDRAMLAFASCAAAAALGAADATSGLGNRACADIMAEKFQRRKLCL